MVTLLLAKYWPEPEKFDPSRYMGKWNKDAHIPFSGGKYQLLCCNGLAQFRLFQGLRGCIGRR